MALINTTTTGVLGSTFFADGTGDLTIQQNGVLVNKITSNGLTYRGTGSVLQVVSTTKTDTFSSATTGSWLDVTGLSLSITPSSASSKIMVFGRITGMGTNAVTRMQVRLVRDSTEISVGDAAGSRLQVSGNELYVADNDGFVGSTVFFLDSPATTSATTYKIQIRNGNSAGTVYVNRNPVDANAVTASRGTSSITVMEIAV